jgi:hypothetical protein
MQQGLSHTPWRKSSYSGNTGNCLEVTLADSVVRVRDSHDQSKGELCFAAAEWSRFTNTVKQDRQLTPYELDEVIG